MKSKYTLLAQFIVVAFCSDSMAESPETQVDDFFAMSPAELASMSVTIATGTPKPVFQSAAVTSVITSEQIKEMGATQLHEVLETVPGIHASIHSDGSFDYNYSVRGIRNQTNAQILFLLNGTRITTPFRGTFSTGTELPIEAIKRVEVIRGPGSALYGADAFAGVVNIITKKADDIHGSKIGVRAGGWGTHSAWGQQSAQWAGWDVAATMQYQNTDGDGGRNIKTDRQSIYDSVLGSDASHAPGSMNTRNGTLDGHLNLQRKHWDINLWGFGTDFGTRAGVGASLDPNGLGKNEQYLGDVRFSTEDWFEDWELTAHTSYHHADFSANIQVFPSGALLPIGTDGNFKSPLDTSSPRILFPNGANAILGRTEQIPAVEVGATFKGWKKHLLRVIGGFRHEQTLTRQAQNFGTGAEDIGGALTTMTNTPNVFLPDSDRTIWSMVFQDEWSIISNLQLTAGLRYDNYSDFGGTLNPRGALVWDVNDKVTSKLLYGRAFRAPSFSEQFNQNNPAVLGNPNLNPETIDTYEWAIDYRPTYSLRTTLNIYHYEIENLIFTVRDPNLVTSTFQNNGRQEGYGGEFEWDWHPVGQVGFRGNYAWQNATNQETGLRVVGVPEHHAYFAADWHFMPHWQVQSQVNWVLDRTNPINAATGTSIPLPDYETVDLTLRGTKLFKHLTLAASMRNLFDTDVREPAIVGLPENLPMPGRNFYFEASVDF